MATRWQDWRDAKRPIHDVNKVVAVFEVDLDGPPGGRLKVKVLEGADGKYLGVPNFGVQNIEMASPYSGSHPQDSVDEAFWDALDGLRGWGADAFWILNDNY